MKKNILGILLGVVLIAGAGVGGYFLGVEDGKAQTTDVREPFMAERLGTIIQQGTPGGFDPGQFTQGQGATGRVNLAGRGATGTIKNIQGNTLVVSTAERELKVVVSTDTVITMTTQGGMSDFKVGDRVTVGGQTEGDTMTATTIQLIPNLP